MLPFAYLLLIGLIAGGCHAVRGAPSAGEVKLVAIGEGWAQSSVKTVVFRQNSVVTHGDTQYAAYYDADGYVVLAKRRLGSEDCEVHRTQYSGNVEDAHNAICIAVDGQGIVHVAWDRHGHSLSYARGTHPGGQRRMVSAIAFVHTSGTSSRRWRQR